MPLVVLNSNISNSFFAYTTIDGILNNKYFHFYWLPAQCPHAIWCVQTEICSKFAKPLMIDLGPKNIEHCSVFQTP